MHKKSNEEKSDYSAERVGRGDRDKVILTERGRVVWTDRRTIAKKAEENPENAACHRASQKFRTKGSEHP